MSSIAKGALGSAGQIAQRVTCTTVHFGVLLKSRNENVSRKTTKAFREDEPEYTGEIDELVLTWLMEDLNITAETCQADPIDVFGDLFALIVSEKPVLHRPDADYVGAVSQLMDWFLEDIEAVARSFDRNPLDVLVDAFKVIVSETPLASRMIEVATKLGSMFEEA